MKRREDEEEKRGRRSESGMSEGGFYCQQLPERKLTLQAGIPKRRRVSTGHEEYKVGPLHLLHSHILLPTSLSEV